MLERARGASREVPVRLRSAHRWIAQLERATVQHRGSRVRLPLQQLPVTQCNTGVKAPFRSRPAQSMRCSPTWEPRSDRSGPPPGSRLPRRPAPHPHRSARMRAGREDAAIERRGPRDSPRRIPPGAAPLFQARKRGIGNREWGIKATASAALRLPIPDSRLPFPASPNDARCVHAMHDRSGMPRVPPPRIDLSKRPQGGVSC
jgi:hypothetical protein